MLNQLLKLLLALVCILLSNLQITANNNSHRVIKSDDNIISYDSAFVVYKVHDGDYLNKIADEFGVPISDIMRANEISAQNATIYVGQILRIPTKGRTNQILKERKRRILYDKENELLKKETYLSSLDQNIDKYEFYIDSLKLKIRRLEKQEVLDKSIDEDNINQILKQMAIAKQIGIEKKDLIVQLKKVEVKYYATKKEVSDVKGGIGKLQVKLEQNAIEYGRQQKEEKFKNIKETEEEEITEEAHFDINAVDEQKPGEESKNIMPGEIENSGESEIEKRKRKNNYYLKEFIHDKKTEDPEIASQEIGLISKYKVKDTEDLQFTNDDKIETNKPETNRTTRIVAKKDPRINKYDESKNPIEIESLEDKFEDQSNNKHSDIKQQNKDEIKKQVISRAIAENRKIINEENNKEAIGKTNFKSKKKPSSKDLKKKNLDHSFFQGSKEYDRYQLFEGLKDVDVSSELDSINRMKAKFYLARGLNEIDKGQYKKANKFISKSLKLSPTFLDAKVLLADLNATFGYNEKAIKLYDEAIEIDSSFAQLYYNRAHCYLKMKKNENAHFDFTHAIRKRENYVLAYAGRASIAIDINDFESAITDYTRILEINNYFIPAYQGRGIAHMEMGNYEQAINDFNIILELSPRESNIYYKRGLAKILTNKLFDACFDLWTASELGYKEAEKTIKRYCD